MDSDGCVFIFSLNSSFSNNVLVTLHLMTSCDNNNYYTDCQLHGIVANDARPL